MKSWADLQGARRLSLIGREAELKALARHCQRLSTPTLFYLEGQGGVGKTAILEEMLVRLRRGDVRGWRGRTPQNLIDLYHIDFQTPTGLADGIKDALNSLGTFIDYTAKVEKMRQRARREEMEREAWKEVWLLFAQALSQLAEREGGLVLALDTVEVLQYTRDPFQEFSKRALPLASVGQWMLEEIFPLLEGPILWIWAGRPTPLMQRLHKAQDVKLVHRTLGPLSREESLTYVETVAQRLQEDEEMGWQRVRDYVSAYPEGLYQGTGGQPILLALAADILRVGANLPPLFYAESVDTLEQNGLDRKAALERMMMEHLLTLQSPKVKALLALGWLRKGANAELLGRLLGLDEKTAQARLESLAKLVLVKRRPQGDHPYFLHDELYYLLERYREIDKPKRRVLYEEIHDYYNAWEDEILEKLRSDLDPWSRTRYEARRRAIQVERLHYRLYDELEAGFETYFLQAEDALDSRDTDLDMLLRSELLRAVTDLQLAQRISSTRLVNRIYNDAAVRWGVRVLLLGNDPDEATKTLQDARNWIEKKIQPPDMLWRWYMHLYEAVVDLKEGHYELARRVLKEVEEALAEMPYSRIVAVLQAFTAAYLGYLERLRGAYFQAVPHYQQATALFRRLSMGALISTLTNLAYVMAMVGRFRHARQVLDEARQRADQEGQPYWKARILNIRVIVEALDGHSRTALRHADDAQLLFDEGEVTDERLLGLLGISRSRAYRYLWNDLVREQRWRQGIQNPLLQAYEEGEKGLRLLKKKERRGSYYHVEALTEFGCILREMAWVAHKIKEDDLPSLQNTVGEDNVKLFHEVGQRAEVYLWKAAGVENRQEPKKPQIKQRIKDDLGGDHYLPTLALTNLGWHYHYQHRPSEYIEKIYDLVEKLIPSSYRLPTLTAKKEESNLLLWSVLGKLEMLRFYVIVRDWKKMNEEGRATQLKAAVRHVVYSLEYDYIVGANSYDLQRAEAGLHQRLISIPDWDTDILPNLYIYGKEVAEEIAPCLDRQETVFLRWLREDFGMAEIWQDLSEGE
jgi:hypothetical protein